MVARRVKKRKAVVCPVSVTVKMIGGKWKPLILYYLVDGKKRFNELQRITGGPSARILTVQLRELEEDKIIKREVYEQIPPRVEYSLTAKGRSLSNLLNAMAKWGIENA